jgi:hypothetical protein
MQGDKCAHRILRSAIGPVLLSDASPREIARRRGRVLSMLLVQATRRRTSQTVAPMSSADNASSQPPSIHWYGQKWLAGW